jgi:rare lipoprotein A (peptidoglycan hydrolase)
MSQKLIACLIILLTAVILSCSTTGTSRRADVTSTRSRDLLRKDRRIMSDESVLYGYASYYADKFHGKPTASGEIFDMNTFTAAHRTLPFGTICRITNLANDRSVNVRINDRGPFVEGRIIDLSKAAAEALDGIRQGILEIKLEILEFPDGYIE